jgi:hypothetical protein
MLVIVPVSARSAFPGHFQTMHVSLLVHTCPRNGCMDRQTKRPTTSANPIHTMPPHLWTSATFKQGKSTCRPLQCWWAAEQFLGNDPVVKCEDNVHFVLKHAVYASYNTAQKRAPLRRDQHCNGHATQCLSVTTRSSKAARMMFEHGTKQKQSLNRVALALHSLSTRCPPTMNTLPASLSSMKASNSQEARLSRTEQGSVVPLWSRSQC